jgi:uncharacterized repeat protein (TIGR03837 family)
LAQSCLSLIRKTHIGQLAAATVQSCDNLSAMSQTRKRWDIFCSVVDNYGDVGVAWRLARQLADEHAVAVRLFVDDRSALRRIAPCDAPGVEVRQWSGPSGAFAAADSASIDAIIETFGCGLPARYLDALCAAPKQPPWVNLEYLSAEPWVEGSHGLASRLPQRPLTRHFYFPGFTPRSGGLLRERGLFARRDAFRANTDARTALWRTLQVGAPAAGTLMLSLFCYPNPALLSLLDAWAVGDTPILCVVPEGVANAELEAWTGSVQRPRETLRRGSLTIANVPFVAQDEYDKLLWTCDLNFVRGEDSFVRAQWAARPLIWHCYPQAENAHLVKLDAFLSRHAAGLAPDVADAYAAFADAWNERRAPGRLWPPFANALPALITHAWRWAEALATVPDLAAGLVNFVEKRV